MAELGKIGLKIGATTREYYRYTGASAELEKRGAGSSRPELAWARRLPEEPAERPAASEGQDREASGTTPLHRE
jgi:hypothetical protein